MKTSSGRRRGARGPGAGADGGARAGAGARGSGSSSSAARAAASARQARHSAPRARLIRPPTRRQRPGQERRGPFKSRPARAATRKRRPRCPGSGRRTAAGWAKMPLPVQVFNLQGAVEPMQIDVDPQEDPQNAPDVNYVVENPTLDLEQYAASYSGLMRIERLQFIADHCPPLRVEALKMALSFVQRTFNVDVYEEIHRKLSEATRDLQSAPDAVPEGGVEPPPLDTAWVEATRKKALLKLEKLDTDLKNYKGNSIKESIRRGHDDLGDHYLDCGDLSNALKCYSRARDYCTSAKHVINMCLNVIKVSVYLQNWSHVLSYVSKAESTPEIAERGERDSQTQAILTKLKCAAGLAELAARKYKQAAKCFLLASFDHCDFPELLSPSNVAVYGGLCALATFDRQELQRNVISSSSFKLFLELEPQVRDIIFKFYESKYASCLKMLDEMKDNLLLDMYLAPHVRTLYTQIRNRALIQYFSPYVSADMRRMATAFNTTVAALEDELTQLILEGLINARIDSHSKILYARDVDQRSTTFEKSLLMGKEFQRRAKAMILRAAVLRNQIHVKSPPREGSQGELTPANSQSRMSTNM
ncbi:COP9 signalosome complex subunit 1 isoform X2 [Myotis daubentonii]|uniref:COP9 signalosome complex subunit 1 isoform X2 n=1 Tax=Myotis daubentonii TaxID=98922 RepID=UPI002872CE5B|nr:COP9 signalosome complex subunit 1 isoform X2 [Myotis daubentonii]